MPVPKPVTKTKFKLRPPLSADIARLFRQTSEFQRLQNERRKFYRVLNQCGLDAKTRELIEKALSVNIERSNEIEIS